MILSTALGQNAPSLVLLMFRYVQEGPSFMGWLAGVQAL